MAINTIENLFQCINREDETSPALKGLRLAAGFAAGLYGFGARLANLRYDLGLTEPGRLSAPLVAVGNLTVGGTGKTPLVMEIVRALTRLGLKTCVLSRGYKGQASSEVNWVSKGAEPLLDACQAGDEPLLMAKLLEVPVAVGRDRYLVGKEVLRTLGPRVLVADDLFQHRSLYRVFNILTLDAEKPLGNGKLLPRGVLREPWTGIRRAQAVVLTHADDPEAKARTKKWLRSHWGSGPVLSCVHRLKGLADHENKLLLKKQLAGMPVLGFCGLGRPEAFKKGLCSLGLEVKGMEAFSDHHPFTPSELDDLWQKARRLGAIALVTSEKDSMRLSGTPRDARLLVTRLELEFDNGPRELERLLAWGLKDWESGSWI
jgi:tetraacyldisaccharide 4'-kinase